jgi:hypothetical protein
MSYAETTQNSEDLDGDFEPSEKFMRQRGGVKSYTKKKNWKKTSSNQNHSLNKGEVSVCIILIKCGYLFFCVDSILPESNLAQVIIGTKTYFRETADLSLHH